MDPSRNLSNAKLLILYSRRLSTTMGSTTVLMVFWAYTLTNGHSCLMIYIRQTDIMGGNEKDTSPLDTDGKKKGCRYVQ